MGMYKKGKEDGTGPYKDSYMKEEYGKGKKELKLGKCEKVDIGMKDLKLKKK